MDPKIGPAIFRLRAIWDGEVGPSSRRALTALGFAALFGLAHVARIGSPLARGATAGVLGALAVGLAARALVLRRRRADARHVIRSIVGRTDPQLGDATLRAMTLVDRTEAGAGSGSPELARLHLTRLLGRTSTDRIAARALAAARRWSGAGVALALVALAAVVVEPFRVVEGLDVLAARAGEAPLALDWIDDVDVLATPPEYLHAGDSPLVPFHSASEPRGSTITVRGRPLRAGRKLWLTDGQDEVPFVDDGSGGLVARWRLMETTQLFVAARFGAVRVRQLDAHPIAAIPDEVPTVKLESAPRTVRLLDEPSIPIHFEATDDHGLREVHLVLRTGTREERRGLSRPQTDAKVDRGGYELSANDAFFKRTYAPVEVTVEARDNDPVTGPKWGKSAAILVIPPQVGEPEALRMAALVKARDAVTDLLADRLSQKSPGPGGGADHARHESEVQARAQTAVEEAIAGTYGGLRVRGRMATLARGQLRRMAAAIAAEKKAPSRDTHQKLLEATEDALLALDAGVRGTGMRDARAVARRMADVADEAAAGASAAQSAAERAAGLARLDASVSVLGAGAKHMLRLDELGLDLGEIVENDLRRIARAREQNSLFHAELAARDLAARLRRPEPSFGGGGGGGVESGTPSASPDRDQASSAEQEMAASEQELEELTRDHANEMNDVAQALDKATSPEELEALRQEAKEHAEAIRRAVKGLPRPGADPGSAEASAAEGREQAEAMAGALERGNPADALQTGKNAQRALEQANKVGQDSKGFFPEERAGREAGKAGETVARELAWLEGAVDRLRKSAAGRAKGELGKSSEDEQKLAERAQKLGRRGQQGEASMPEEMLERLEEAEQSMREAQRALKEGDGERGAAQQQKAQRALEMAQNQEQDQQDSESGDRDGKKESADGKRAAKEAEVPDKDKHKGPEDFRRRVQEGLGKTSDPMLRRALKRYAEGLLR